MPEHDSHFEQMKFEGVDEKILDELIRNAEADLVIAETALASFSGDKRSRLDSYTEESPTADSTPKLLPEIQIHAVLLQKEVNDKREYLEKLKADREAVLKGKNSRDRIQ